MKYKLMVILLISVILSACGNASLKDVLYDKIPYDTVLGDFCIDDELFVVDKQGVSVFNTNQSFKRKIKYNKLDSCTGITIANNKLYAFNYNDGNIYSFDKNGNFLNVFEMNLEKINVKKIKVDEKNRFFIQYTDKDIISKLLYFDITTKKTIHIDGLKLSDFALYTEDRLLILDGSTPDKVYVYDLSKKVRSEHLRLDTNGRYIDYDFDKKIIYYLDKSQMTIGFYRDNDLDTLNILDINIQGSINCIKMQSAKNYIYLLSNNKIYGINKKGTPTNKSAESKVVIYNIDDSSPEARRITELFYKKRPDVDLEFKIITDNRKLKTKLMSGDDDFDVLSLSNEYIPEYSGKEIICEAFEDLGKYKAVQDIVKGLYPQIVNACSFDKKLFGLPRDLGMQALNVKEGVLSALNIPIPENTWSWEDFYQLARSIKSAAVSKGMSNVYITNMDSHGLFNVALSSWGRDFVDREKKESSFNSSEFIAVLEYAKKFADEKLLPNMESNSKTDIFAFQSSRSISFMQKTGEASDKLINYPLGTDGHTIPMNISYLCVNKNSKNKDIAAELVCDWVSPENIKTRNFRIYKENIYKGDVPMFKFNSSPYLEKLYDFALGASKTDFIYAMQDNVIINTNAGKFFKGEITARQAAEQIDEKISKMIKE